MEDESSRMWPVGTMPLTYGFPAGDPMPDPRSFLLSPTARCAARLGAFALFSGEMTFGSD
ncbi:hypothetical protein PAN31117_03176 [Pandoraea anapnoica]|uniref:Uncharacterized protein n=1 Tax=Pandoraea anapnoica TaxID=2508301 RepID=A0A5E5A5N6_9BURK|nr:hypothetical protein [Pandoraea anapnoica]VVE68971.1 hypothetical protein PAN31117_03176 [Pandoraea anapnoica]